MRNNSHNLTFFVKVKGRVVDEYKHHGKTFIEGRKGSDYTLEFYNGTSIRRKVVLSVDGLNVTTGDTNWTSGYVVDPYSTVSIPGWKINSAKAAKFEFNSVPKSYNQHNDSGDKSNVGVIGCMVFDEIPQVKVVNNYIPVYPRPYWGSWGPAYPATQDCFGGFVGINSSSAIPSNGNVGAVYMGAASASCGDISSQPRGLDDITISNKPRGIAPLPKLCAADPEPVQQSIGTKWGEETQFYTTQVHLNWQNTSSCALLVYYDSRKGLENRGINFHHKHKHHTEPNAFPGLNQGCPYPKN